MSAKDRGCRRIYGRPARSSSYRAQCASRKHAVQQPMRISCDDDSEKPPMASPELNLINNSKLEGLSHPVQVIAITGGKGGVGKTSVSVNLATAMAAAGKRVL